MTTLIEADIATAYAHAKGVPTQSSLLEAGLDPDLDITFNCLGYDANGVANQGVGFAYASASGSMPFVNANDNTASAGATASGAAIWGTVNTGTATAYALAYGDLVLENLKKNWIAWSKIGSMDFTIDRKNIAGTRALDWSGWTYCVKKLGGKAVAYGENGVSFLIPSGKAWGLKTIYRVGLKSKQAVAGTEDIHFFIDNKDQLFSLSEGLQKLDYSEYLTVLTDPVLSFDIEANLLYICDGTYGFVYSPIDKSLGKGPVNITGISSQGGTLYVAAPAAITTPAFEICTDIYDAGSRAPKTLWAVEVGTNIEQALSVCINHRKSKAESFSSTPWTITNPSGVAFIPCYGVEFQFRVKADEYEEFDPDYINVFGAIHGY